MDDAIQQILQKNNVVVSGNSTQAADPIQTILQKNGIAGAGNNNAIAADSAIGNQDDNGMCQRFAEKQTTGRTGLYSSASAAYQDQAQKGNVNTDFSQMQPGDLLYLDDPNQPDGHVGIIDEPGSMVSATYNGVQKSNINDWLKSTGQRPLGFVRGYK